MKCSYSHKIIRVVSYNISKKDLDSLECTEWLSGDLVHACLILMARQHPITILNGVQIYRIFFENAHNISVRNLTLKTMMTSPFYVNDNI